MGKGEGVGVEYGGGSGGIGHPIQYSPVPTSVTIVAIESRSFMCPISYEQPHQITIRGVEGWGWGRLGVAGEWGGCPI